MAAEIDQHKLIDGPSKSSSTHTAVEKIADIAGQMSPAAALRRLTQRGLNGPAIMAHDGEKILVDKHDFPGLSVLLGRAAIHGFQIETTKMESPSENLSHVWLVKPESNKKILALSFFDQKALLRNSDTSIRLEREIANALIREAGQQWDSSRPSEGLERVFGNPMGVARDMGTGAGIGAIGSVPGVFAGMVVGASASIAARSADEILHGGDKRLSKGSELYFSKRTDATLLKEVKAAQRAGFEFRDKIVEQPDGTHQVQVVMLRKVGTGKQTELKSVNHILLPNAGYSYLNGLDLALEIRRTRERS